MLFAASKRKIIIFLILILIGVFVYAKNVFDLRDFFRGLKPFISQTPKEAKLPSFILPFNLPKDFSIKIFVQGITNPRVLVRDPSGFLVASLTSAGKVVVLPDRDQDGQADKIITLISGLNKPHGLSFRCEKEKCQLYVAEENNLSVYDYDKSKVSVSQKKKLLDLPSGGNHFTRTVLFRPKPFDKKLLISIGSSCNVCAEKDNRRGAILEYDIETKESKIFASGLRNSVFMATEPVTGRILATDMGRDWLGDNLPPDEINIIEESKNYGWPICYGKNIHDTDFDPEKLLRNNGASKNTYIRNLCMAPFETSSFADIPAHSAPLGLDFFGLDWPEEYRGDLLVAYHGSWNRSVPTGYKIVRFQIDSKGNLVSEKPEDFITGWLNDKNEAFGRPAGILIGQDKIFISDDKANMIYQVDLNDGPPSILPLSRGRSDGQKIISNNQNGSLEKNSTAVSKNMKIESSAFLNNQSIPIKYTCDGQDINPPITWSNVPDNTKSLVLIMDDPDAPRGVWDHWLLWNIDPKITGISENSIPTGAIVGKNSWPKNSYGGPCPPDREHRYFFKLYALDTILNLPKSSGKKELENAMAGHIISQTELIGRYNRNK